MLVLILDVETRQRSKQLNNQRLAHVSFQFGDNFTKSSFFEVIEIRRLSEGLSIAFSDRNHNS
jgi:hypothetical protein